MMTLAPIVEAVNLKKTYMLGKVSVNALRGVNLRVESGDFLAVLGPSGSEKSTLLSLIGTLDKPTDGRMLIEGVDVSTHNDDQLADLRRRNQRHLCTLPRLASVKTQTGRSLKIRVGQILKLRFSR
jgi:ABC-type lipoprotein export system ATPase subunit